MTYTPPPITGYCFVGKNLEGNIEVVDSFSELLLVLTKDQAKDLAVMLLHHADGTGKM